MITFIMSHLVWVTTMKFSYANESALYNCISISFSPEVYLNKKHIVRVECFLNSKVYPNIYTGPDTRFVI